MTRRHIPPQLHPRLLLFLTISLVMFGLLMIYNASVIDAIRDFGDKYYYLKLQSRWAVFGIAIMLIISRINPLYWKKIATPLFAAVVLLLVLVLIPGIGNRYLGARRWIGIGSLVIQPAEAAKFGIVIYLAAMFSKRTSLTPLTVSLSTVVGLIMLEPDLGTSLVIVSTAVSLYFLSGGHFKHLLLAICAIAPLVLLLILSSPYRKDRLLSYLNPESDPQGSSYHIRQALIALGNGGIFGVGLGQSRQKYNYLPEVTTDSIFAVVGEELGLMGSSALVAMLVALMLLGLSVADKSQDRFTYLLASGMITWIASQVFLNIASIIGILPLTGVPLPFISYGGSSLVIALASIGVLLSIARHAK